MGQLLNDGAEQRFGFICGNFYNVKSSRKTDLNLESKTPFSFKEGGFFI